jgi:hypothetical protein
VSDCCIAMAVFALMKSRAPNFTSAADNMTAYIICEKMKMVPLLVVEGYVVPSSHEHVPSRLAADFGF